MTFMAALPALASAAASIFSSLNKGGNDNKKVSNYDKNQQKFWNQYSQNATQNLGGQQDVMGLLQSMLNPNSDFFKNFENQQMNQFNEQTLPNIAERFAGGAHGGALSSSGFGQALSGGAAGLQSNLAAGKSGMIMQALQQLMQQYNQQATNVLGAQPFDLQDKGGGLGGGFLGGLDFEKLFSGFQGAGGQNNQYQNKYPLTQGYDQQFRQQGAF
jgi:hypothetical protein